MEEYGEFIILSDEGERKLSEMTEAQINAITARLSEAILQTQFQIKEELNGEE